MVVGLDVQFRDHRPDVAQVLVQLRELPVQLCVPVLPATEYAHARNIAPAPGLLWGFYDATPLPWLVTGGKDGPR